MKIDSTSLISSTADSQISGKKSEEELKSFSDALDKAKESGDNEELKKVSQQFEAFFINEIFKSMRKSSDWGGSIVEKSHARGVYESMFDEKISDEISQGRGIGIGDMIYKQMLNSYGAESQQAANAPNDIENDNDSTDDEQPKSLDLKG